jgi:hypothetical protein
VHARLAVAVLAFILAARAEAQAPAGSGMPQRPPRNAPRHPDAGQAVECAGCHADATPAALEAWSRSRHGLVLVKCTVCHGSTGADFTRVAAPGRCSGCHPAEVESVAKARLGAQGCFSCHPGHALLPVNGEATSPHAAPANGARP